MPITAEPRLLKQLRNTQGVNLGSCGPHYRCSDRLNHVLIQPVLHWLLYPAIEACQPLLVACWLYVETARLNLYWRWTEFDVCWLLLVHWVDGCFVAARGPLFLWSWIITAQHLKSMHHLHKRLRSHHHDFVSREIQYNFFKNNNTFWWPLRTVLLFVSRPSTCFMAAIVAKFNWIHWTIVYLLCTEFLLYFVKGLAAEKCFCKFPVQQKKEN